MASRYLREVHGIQLSPATLARFACRDGQGPRFGHDGRFPIYRIDDLDAFAVRRRGPLRTGTRT